MPSTNKTTVLELNQWLDTDRPKMEDFNSDNLKLENYIATLKTVPELTGSRAVVSDSSGNLTPSSVTDLELAHLAGISGNVQTQLSGKQGTITGGASSITDSNLTASRALVSDASGKVAAAAITAAELAHLSGISSNIQTQLNGKQATISGGASSIVSSNLTTSRALVSDSSGKVAVAAITAAELAHLSGISSNIQVQLNAKQGLVVGGASSITISNLTTSRALVSDASGKVAVSAVTAAELAYLDGVTSAIQTQLNAKLGSTATAANSSKWNNYSLLVQSSTPAGASNTLWFQT